MKKIIALFVLATLFVASNAIAQTQLVATLKHGDTTKLFYGSSALQTAHDAAEEGDVITLSEGVFNATTFSKAVKVRGIGSIKQGTIAASLINGVSFVGGLSNVSFEGVRIGSISQNSAETSSISFINCIIDKFQEGVNINWSFIKCILLSTSSVTRCTVFYENCVILAISVGNEESLSSYRNCIIRLGIGRENEAACGMRYNTFQNCILCNDGICGGFTILTTLHNCVGIGSLLNFDATIDPTSNVRVDEYSTIFKTYLGGDYSDSETFELTDEAAATYLGDDGKQVGIYGGDFPFTTTLSYPQATSVNVAKKTVDGKLAVDIKFNGAE